MVLSLNLGHLGLRWSTARSFPLFTTPFGCCWYQGYCSGGVKRAQDDSVFYGVFGYRCGSGWQRSFTASLGLGLKAFGLDWEDQERPKIGFQHK